ncbi:MAG: taurine-pyruvate aminotransferase, partial [Porticoccaceae bacterium]
MNKPTESVEMADLVEMDMSHAWHHLTPHKPLEEKDPLVIVKGEGMRIWDQNGKEHLDAVS